MYLQGCGTNTIDHVSIKKEYLRGSLLEDQNLKK